MGGRRTCVIIVLEISNVCQERQTGTAVNHECEVWAGDCSSYEETRNLPGTRRKQLHEREQNNHLISDMARLKMQE